MQKRLLKYCLLIAVTALVAYKSVYIEKLDAHKKTKVIDLQPAEFAKNFWTSSFVPYLDSAVVLDKLITEFRQDANIAYSRYSHSQGIDNRAFFLVKGEGTIKSISEDSIAVALDAGGATTILNTGIYFGNAVRDVTGRISMGDFTNTMDYNTVSSELNKILRAEVVVPFRAKAKVGDHIIFTGCLEINKEEKDITNNTILPVKIIL